MGVPVRTLPTGTVARPSWLAAREPFRAPTVKAPPPVVLSVTVRPLPSVEIAAVTFPAAAVLMAESTSAIVPAGGGGGVEGREHGGDRAGGGEGDVEAAAVLGGDLEVVAAADRDAAAAVDLR